MFTVSLICLVLIAPFFYCKLNRMGVWAYGGWCILLHSYLGREAVEPGLHALVSQWFEVSTPHQSSHQQFSLFLLYTHHPLPSLRHPYISLLLTPPSQTPPVPWCSLLDVFYGSSTNQGMDRHHPTPLAVVGPVLWVWPPPRGIGRPPKWRASW